MSRLNSFRVNRTGVQWHPEKNNFEWARSADGWPLEATSHSPHAVLVSQYAADFFVQEARKSSHLYVSVQEVSSLRDLRWSLHTLFTHAFTTARTQEDAALIWNYPVTKTTGDFVQKYFFHF